MTSVSPTFSIIIPHKDIPYLLMHLLDKVFLDRDFSFIGLEADVVEGYAADLGSAAGESAFIHLAGL